MRPIDGDALAGIIEIAARNLIDTGLTSCIEVCRKIGCDPSAFKFPEWSLTEIGGSVEVIEE